MTEPRRFNLPYEYDPDTVADALTQPPTPSQPDMGGADLERLFDQTMRGPFGGYRPELITEENPYFPQAPGGVAEDNAFPLYLAGFILGKVQNDRFIHGPPDGDESAIDDEENRLPGWSVVDDTTNGGTVTWEQEANGSAYLRFTVEDGQVGDELYIEQDIFISGGNYDILSMAADWLGVAGNGEGKYDTFIKYQYVYPDGTLAGTEEEEFYSNSTSERIDRKWLVTSSRMYAFVRVKIGVRVDTAYATGAEDLADLQFTWIDDPESYDVTLPFMRSSFTPDTGGPNFDIPMWDLGLPLQCKCLDGTGPRPAPVGLGVHQRHDLCRHAGLLPACQRQRQGQHPQCPAHGWQRGGCGLPRSHRCCDLRLLSSATCRRASYRIRLTQHHGWCRLRGVTSGAYHHRIR